MRGRFSRVSVEDVIWTFLDRPCRRFTGGDLACHNGCFLMQPHFFYPPKTVHFKFFNILYLSTLSWLSDFYFFTQSVIIKSAERNAKNIYLARMDILGVDKNQNRASSPIYSSIISPSSDRSFYSGSMEYSSSPPSSTYSNPCNGHVSPIGQVSSSSSWFSSSDSSKGISTMVGSTPYSFTPTTAPPPPPPGLGPPNTMTSPVVSTASGYIRDFSVSPTGSYASIESSSGESLFCNLIIWIPRIIEFAPSRDGSHDRTHNNRSSLFFLEKMNSFLCKSD